MRGVRQLADNGLPVVVNINPDDFIARHHNVVNADLFQIQHRQEHVLIATGDLRAGFVHDGTQFVFAERATDGDVCLYTNHAHQHPCHHIQQPDQRHHQNKQRC